MLECPNERLGGQLVREIDPHPPMQVAMYLPEVPLEHCR
jgi:hypothetical protein